MPLSLEDEVLGVIEKSVENASLIQAVQEAAKAFAKELVSRTAGNMDMAGIKTALDSAFPGALLNQDVIAKIAAALEELIREKDRQQAAIVAAQDAAQKKAEDEEKKLTLEQQAQAEALERLKATFKDLNSQIPVEKRELLVSAQTAFEEALVIAAATNCPLAVVTAFTESTNHAVLAQPVVRIGLDGKPINLDGPPNAGAVTALLSNTASLVESAKERTERVLLQRTEAHNAAKGLLAEQLASWQAQEAEHCTHIQAAYTKVDIEIAVSTVERVHALNKVVGKEHPALTAEDPVVVSRMKLLDHIKVEQVDREARATSDQIIKTERQNAVKATREKINESKGLEFVKLKADLAASRKQNKKIAKELAGEGCTPERRAELEVLQIVNRAKNKDISDQIKGLEANIDPQKSAEIAAWKDKQDQLVDLQQKHNKKSKDKDPEAIRTRKELAQQDKAARDAFEGRDDVIAERAAAKAELEEVQAQDHDVTVGPSTLFDGPPVTEIEAVEKASSRSTTAANVLAGGAPEATTMTVRRLDPDGTTEVVRQRAAEAVKDGLDAVPPALDTGGVQLGTAKVDAPMVAIGDKAPTTLDSLPSTSVASSSVGVGLSLDNEDLATPTVAQVKEESLLPVTPTQGSELLQDAGVTKEQEQEPVVAKPQIERSLGVTLDGTTAVRAEVVNVNAPSASSVSQEQAALLRQQQAETARLAEVARVETERLATVAKKEAATQKQGAYEGVPIGRGQEVESSMGLNGVDPGNGGEPAALTATGNLNLGNDTLIPNPSLGKSMEVVTQSVEQNKSGPNADVSLSPPSTSLVEVVQGKAGAGVGGP
jgi:hypothetical protein